MSSKIEVDFKKQLYDYDCLPACLYMILDHSGSKIKYSKLLRLCHTDRYGTTIREATKAGEKLGFSVKVENMDLSDLIKQVRNGTPIIAFVDPYYFPWMKMHCSHSVIVVGVHEEGVTLLDPVKGEKNCPFTVFSSAWNPFNNLVMMVGTQNPSEVARDK